MVRLLRRDLLKSFFILILFPLGVKAFSPVQAVMQAGFANLSSATINGTFSDAPFHVGPIHDSAGTNANILSARSFPSLGDNSNGHSYEDISTYAGDSNTSVASYDARLTSIGGNNYGHMIGYQSAIVHSSTGTLGILYDFGAFAAPSGGTVTFRYAFYAADSIGTGALNNQYGFYCENLTKGLLNNFCFYSTGTTPSVINGEIRGGNTGAGGVKIMGTQTNDNAIPGDYGEQKESDVSTAQNTGSSGTLFDATSVFLTSGDWDVSGMIIYNRNAATFTSTDFEIGITTNASTNAAGLINGSNYTYSIGVVPNNFSNFPIDIPNYRQSLLNGTTVYLKAIAGNYNAGNPQYFCRLSARRPR